MTSRASGSSNDDVAGAAVSDAEPVAQPEHALQLAAGRTEQLPEQLSVRAGRVDLRRTAVDRCQSCRDQRRALTASAGTGLAEDSLAGALHEVLAVPDRGRQVLVQVSGKPLELLDDLGQLKLAGQRAGVVQGGRLGQVSDVEQPVEPRFVLGQPVGELEVVLERCGIVDVDLRRGVWPLIKTTRETASRR